MNKNELVGINLPIIINGRITSKDIAVCTGEDMLIWAKFTLPGFDFSIADKYETLTERMKLYSSIVNYHDLLRKLTSQKKGEENA